jgi:hypothetical protein
MGGRLESLTDASKGLEGAAMGESTVWNHSQTYLRFGGASMGDRLESLTDASKGLKGAAMGGRLSGITHRRIYGLEVPRWPGISRAHLRAWEVPRY